MLDATGDAYSAEFPLVAAAVAGMRAGMHLSLLIRVGTFRVSYICTIYYYGIC